MLLRADDRKSLGIEEEFAAELAEYAAELAPSRFTVCLVEEELLDAVIVGWGLALPDSALVYLFSPDGEPGQSTLMTFSSVARLRDRVCRDAAVRLIWVDHEPLPHSVSGGL
jgi:hypothetical protein